MNKTDININIGDIVKVNVLNYIGFRGTVEDIIDNVAFVKVPTYYGGEFIIVQEYCNKLKKAQ